MSKKLLMINNSLTGGGSERVMSMLANELACRGYEIDMLISNGNAPETYKLSESINKIKFKEDGLKGFRFTFNWLKLIRKYQKQIKYQAVISFLMGNNVLTLMAGLGLNQKIIVSERNNPSIIDNKKRVLKIGEQFIYPYAKYVVFQTEDVKAIYKNSIRKKGVVIPNPVNPDLGNQYPNELRKKVIVSAGRLTKQKNYPMLLKAFKMFNERCPGYQLVIYGQGVLLDDLKLLCRKLKIENSVHFAGFVDNVDDYIRKAAMFVMSSDFEGISNTMIEALAMGVPTICTDCPVGGARMMIQSGKNGILVPVGDEKALSEAMIKLAENPEYAAALGQRALKVREDYSIRKIADMWEKIILS